MDLTPTTRFRRAPSGSVSGNADQPARRRPDGLYAVLAVAVMLEAVGVGMIFPLLARIQDADHFATYGLGIMSGANFFATLATQITIGRHLDGPRAHLVLIGGLVLGIGAAAWFGLASTLWALCAARALGGVSYGIVMPAALKAAAAGLPGSRRGARLGRLSSIQMAGIVLGPLLGTALAAAGGLRAPFLSVAAATAVALGALLALPAGRHGAAGVDHDGLAMAMAPVPGAAEAGLGAALDGAPGAGPLAAGSVGAGGASSSGAGGASSSEAGGASSSEAGGASSSEAGPRAARAERRPAPTSAAVIALLLLGAAAQLPTGLYDSLWSRLLTDRGASPLLIGLSLTAFGIPFVVLAPLGGRVAARGRPLLWAAGSLCVCSVFLALYGIVASPLAITGLGMVEACFQAVAVPAGLAAVAIAFPDRWAATGQSWFSGAGTAAAGLSAVAGAPAYGAFGPAAVFVGGAVGSIGLAVASVGTARRSRAVPPGPG